MGHVANFHEEYNSKNNLNIGQHLSKL